MTLTIVDSTNITVEPYRNLRKHLIAQGITTSITPSYSEKTSLPVITAENEYRIVAKSIGRSSKPSFLSTITLHCIGTGSYESANDIANSISSYLDHEDLYSVNMNYSDVKLSSFHFTRGAKVIQGRTVTVQYIIL